MSHQASDILQSAQIVELLDQVCDWMQKMIPLYNVLIYDDHKNHSLYLNANIVMLAYLIKYGQMSLEESIQALVSKKSNSDIKLGQMDVIKMYEQCHFT